MDTSVFTGKAEFTLPVTVVSVFVRPVVTVVNPEFGLVDREVFTLAPRPAATMAASCEPPVTTADSATMGATAAMSSGVTASRPAAVRASVGLVQ
ncbi:hypothetical protein AWN90_07230 [Nocardia terpenica]|uniref:Uncharacterized protein n=1 Tax=Nocardia terpenica TaxID=455432 RepID=A0A164IT94_9NOCA|nr:hypothetical protein AWN90_07230 [Nocardia terpenica]